jgi:L-histidine N-alpha-methyltransferase
MSFLSDVVAGLKTSPRRISSKYFYDAAGSDLFEQICDLDEYYVTRTELGVLKKNGPDIAKAMGPNTVVVEFGSGSAVKTEILFSNLESPKAWVPVDISDSALEASEVRMNALFPDLKVSPVHADFTAAFALPKIVGGRLFVFYPGSTIGNFAPAEVSRFLGRVREMVGADGGMLIGVDLKKSPATLHQAYNDSKGVTAAFNKNVLKRMEAELGAKVDVDAFEHYAFFNPGEGRIEMHLVASKPTRIEIENETFEFAAGESILTEFSYKYAKTQFEDVARASGFSVDQYWTDEKSHFGVWLLT